MLAADWLLSVADRDKALEWAERSVKVDSAGYRYWSPLQRNNDATTRQDLAQVYGSAASRGEYYHVSGRVGYSGGEWRQTRAAAEEEVSVPINVYDKIKVKSCFLVQDNTCRTAMMTGLVGVQNRNSRNNADVFLQEVSKCASPLCTMARYKTVDTEQCASPFTPVTVFSSTINVNFPRGVYELGVGLAALNGWHAARGGGRVVYQFVPPVQNNNSVTFDGIVACVGNELTFKDKAKRGDSIFKILRKKQLKTDKKLIPFWSEGKPTGPEDLPDVTSAGLCECHRCTSADWVRNFRRGAKRGGDDDDDALAPLSKRHEVQVYDRSLNCSAISGANLLPALCQLCVEILRDKTTAFVDLALARTTAAMEQQMNSLIPSHIACICELMCWSAETRKMSPEKQARFSHERLEPALKKLRIGRYNFAQSGGWLQALGGGHRLNTTPATTIVSHKYGNPRTVALFSSPTKKTGLAKKVRRRKGPVFLASISNRFRQQMIARGLKRPVLEEC